MDQREVSAERAVDSAALKAEVDGVGEGTPLRHYTQHERV